MPLGCGTPEDFLESFRKTFAYTKIAGLGRGATRRLEDATLLKVFRCFFELGLATMAPDSDEPSFLDLEINPFLLSCGNLVAVDGFARFGEGFKSRPKVPVQGIGHLLKPQTAAVIGVSARDVNVGRTILRNLLHDGFPAQAIRIIRPGGGQIDGVDCVDSVAALPWVADLLVLAISATQAPGVVEEILDSGKAHSLILIPGGMDETEGGKDVAARIRKRLAEARASGGPAPVMVGPNCLGVRSRPGHYDTLFIPSIKFPQPEAGSPRNLALVLQSGAFLLTRLSKLPLLDSVYAISTGNQMDLCTSDFIQWISTNAPEVAVLGLYIEGYKDGEGLDAYHAIRRATVAGKTVVVYKAGRTREGRSATSSHTASMAGDYETAVDAMRRAGAIVADTFEDFGGLVMLASLLAHKKISARRLGVISNAGFETVGISDSVDSAAGFSLGRLSGPSSEALKTLLDANGLASLVNLKNPLDLTPMAGDAAYFDSLTTMMDDPGLDAVVLGLVPFAPVIATLPPGLKAEDDVELPTSMPSRLAAYYGACEKPLVTVVDAGPLYDALAAALLRARVPVFRSCDQAMRCLQKYLDARIQNGR
jgi:acyl-CoA synthetase (NDP forming)